MNVSKPKPKLNDINADVVTAAKLKSYIQKNLLLKDATMNYTGRTAYGFIEWFDYYWKLPTVGDNNYDVYFSISVYKKPEDTNIEEVLFFEKYGEIPAVKLEVTDIPESLREEIIKDVNDTPVIPYTPTMLNALGIE